MRFVDRWREIAQVLLRRKLRTALTALAVAWGIFMLVVLLAAGNGLSRGTEAQFANDAMNAVWVHPGVTSKPHEGLPKGRRVRLALPDVDMVRKSSSTVDFATGRLYPVPNVTVAHGTRQGVFPIRAVHPDNLSIENAQVVLGRYLDPLDEKERRKVAVLGRKVVESLFPRGASPLGAWLRIGRGVWQVVGVFEEENEEREQQMIYVPMSSAQLAWTAAARVDEIAFTVGDADRATADALVADVRATLARTHGFDVEDKSALRTWNNQEMAEMFGKIFGGIRAFVWIIGLGTILAGVVGVGNIMLISVQERTREFGLRKAIGAPPWAIVVMVLEEALAITLVSGYAGLLAAIAVVSAVNSALPPVDFFKRPEVDLGVGLAATAVLTVTGMLAGLVPARRAARTNPIAALRVE